MEIAYFTTQTYNLNMIIDDIRKIRKNKNISQEKIAKFLNISQGTYRDIENQKIRLSLENYLLICQFLEISPMKLLNNKENEQFILLSNTDIFDLNRILTKINSQSNIINDNHGTININNEKK